jgi:hypothetical protein
VYANQPNLRKTLQPIATGKYPGLNGLKLSDDFGRHFLVEAQLRILFADVRWANKITGMLSRDLTSEKAGLKYREIPANQPPCN